MSVLRHRGARRALGLAMSVVLVLACLAAGAGGASASPSVAIIDLGTMSGHSRSEPRDLNDSGVVVGELRGGGAPHAFVWTLDGGMVDLQDALGSSFATFATAVNNSGEVVGRIANGSAFSWIDGVGATLFPPLPPSPSADILDINAGGQFVGGADDFAHFGHAFIGTRAGGLVDLGTVGAGWNSRAFDINDAGEVVGFSHTIAGDPTSCYPIPFCNREAHAFYWSADDGMVDLGTLDNSPGSISFAWAINETGQVVGTSRALPPTGPTSEPAGPVRAFIWTETDGMEDIGTLGDSASVNDINDAGQVVGCSTLANGNNHAFIWTQADGMVDLGTLGGATSCATDVNELGQVVGGSTLANGESRAFLWTAADGMVDLGILDGASGSGATQLNETGMVVGTSFFSGGVTHATVWQVGPTGPADADSDGVLDDVDSDSGAGTDPPGFSDDTGTGVLTSGVLTSGAVSVVDAPDPSGVRITATTNAVLSVCPTPTPYELEISAGYAVTVTCGSVRIEDVTLESGPGGGAVTVTVTGGASVTFPEGTSGTVDTVGGLSVTDVSGEGVTLTVGGVSAPVPEGDANVIQRGSGSDRITGTSGNDVILDLGGSNTIDGRGGDDSIVTTGTGSDTIVGGEGDDTIDAGEGSNTIKSGPGHDSITTGSGSDTIDAGDGDDMVWAGDGSNNVKGGAGDDSITAGAGSDTIDGGTGTDTCNPGGGSNKVKNCNP